MKRLIISSIFATLVLVAYGQERKQTINKEYALYGSAKVLMISNVNGFIKVEGYDGQKVTMEINEHLKAKSSAALEEMISKIGIEEEEFGDTLEVYISTPCSCDCEKKSRYNWNNCNIRGKYNYDFTIKVPRELNLNLATVNDGDIKVNNVDGRIKANNINGAIFLEEIREAVYVHTINGDIEIEYASLPGQDSEYYTLNGDLTVYYPPTLSADMSFKSFNGDFYTNFNIEHKLPVLSMKTEEGHRGTTYKINETTEVRVGSGGIHLDFETFNGDIFIRKGQ